MKIDKQVSVQQAVAQSSGEITQLKKTITALRDELKIQKIKHMEEINAVERESRTEPKQLKETIVALREKMEKINEKSHKK